MSATWETTRLTLSTTSRFTPLLAACKEVLHSISITPLGCSAEALLHSPTAGVL